MLNQVDRASFFAKFEEAHAVQYFYEPFLQAYDPDLRKQLGVWYTPPEIVQYMVARIDAVLREEFALPDGLADKNVYVLDPCCGTGSYLVEVLKKIHETFTQRGNDALIAADLKEAAKTRIFGFEILPAPFVVSHLQIGLLLQNLGAPLAEKGNERISVFLTNALTGWEPPKEPKTRLLYPELEEERDAAEHVKRDAPILVILGNPPYNGFAGVAVKEERVLTTAYRTTKNAPAPQGQGLNDLYIRFYRMAERRIAEMSGHGIVCFISNYSWLDGLSFTGMRETYLEKFDRIWIDNLHGDRIISEYAPTGETSETIFAMQGTSQGIKIGTAIAVLAKKKVGQSNVSPPLYRDVDEARAAARRQALLTSLAARDFDKQYSPLSPIRDLGLPLKPRVVGLGYLDWPLLSDLLPTSFPGVKTSRDKLVVDFDKETLTERMEALFDPALTYSDWHASYAAVVETSGQFDPIKTRAYLIKRGFLPENILRYQYRPFDVRWLYWEPETNLLDRKREEYYPHLGRENFWIEARQKQPMDKFDRGFVTRLIGDNFGNGLSSFFPLSLKNAELHGPLIKSPKKGPSTPNLSELAEKFLNTVAAEHEHLFFHAIAVLNDPAYRSQNSGALRQDWPRIPLPTVKEILLASAQLGRLIAGLFDTESPIEGVTAGDLRTEMRNIAVINRTGGGSLSESDLLLTSGWGHAGKGGVTMPGKGRLHERDYSPIERKAILGGAQAQGLSEKQAFAHLGEQTCDVYLNDAAYWSNIPTRVWDYTIGGYQVIKKWLSYREQALLGRSLSKDEVRYVQEMARRIAAILLLEPALDANYDAVKQNTYPWPGKEQRLEGRLD